LVSWGRKNQAERTTPTLRAAIEGFWRLFRKGRDNTFGADCMEKSSACFQAVVPALVGEEPIVPDFHETGGEYMEEKAANEFIFCQLHDFDGVMVFVVLPFEAYHARVRVIRYNTTFRNGDPVGISAEIPDNVGSVLKRPLTIAYP
jgi:hypothetical protein